LEEVFVEEAKIEEIVFPIENLRKITGTERKKINSLQIQNDMSSPYLSNPTDQFDNFEKHSRL
jgi:hypothetical protein